MAGQDALPAHEERVRSHRRSRSGAPATLALLAPPPGTAVPASPSSTYSPTPRPWLAAPEHPPNTQYTPLRSTAQHSEYSRTGLAKVEPGRLLGDRRKPARRAVPRSSTAGEARWNKAGPARRSGRRSPRSERDSPGNLNSGHCLVESAQNNADLGVPEVRRIGARLARLVPPPPFLGHAEYRPCPGVMGAPARRSGRGPR